MCWLTTAPSHCRAASPIRIERAKWNRGVGHAQKTPLKGQRFENLEDAQAYLDHWEEHWADTRIHGTTKRQVGGHVRRREAGADCLCRWSRSAITSTANAPWTWTAASKWKPLTTARRPAGSAGACRSNGTAQQVRLLDPKTGQLLREHLRQAARPASHP